MSVSGALGALFLTLSFFWVISFAIHLLYRVTTFVAVIRGKEKR